MPSQLTEVRFTVEPFNRLPTTIPYGTITEIEIATRNGSVACENDLPSRNPASLEIALEQDAAERLYDYARLRLDPNLSIPERNQRNCYQFGLVIAGLVDIDFVGQRLFEYEPTLAENQTALSLHSSQMDLHFGSAYALHRPPMWLPHCIVGMPHPNTSLSVWGVGGLLQIRQTSREVDHYKADSMHLVAAELTASKPSPFLERYLEG